MYCVQWHILPFEIVQSRHTTVHCGYRNKYFRDKHVQGILGSNYHFVAFCDSLAYFRNIFSEMREIENSWSKLKFHLFNQMFLFISRQQRLV